MKLCIFPNDPLIEYVKKGEVKSRYYNPLNFFDEIHVMDPINNRIEPNLVQTMFGDAKVVIHPIGKINSFQMKKKITHIVDIINKISPDIIRAYNPLVQGWLAASSSKKLNIPFIVSIHADYKNEIEKEYQNSWKILKFLKLRVTRMFTEKFVFFCSDSIICASKSYAKSINQINKHKIIIIYNRVSLKQFSNKAKSAIIKEKPIILNVGNFRKIKNQECLIRAIKDVDAHLVLIGKGEMKEYLIELSKKTGVEEKVEFIESVDHSKIQEYYKSAEICAFPIIGGGIAIPVIESLASGCITVAAEPEREKNEPFDKFIYYVKNTPSGFSDIFHKILKNTQYYKNQRNVISEFLKKFDENEMEKREKCLYSKIIYKN